MRTVAVGFAFALVALPIQGQAVSEWRSAAGLPAAVIETVGGDVEEFVAVLPPNATPPSDVAGLPTTVDTTRGALILSLRAPVLRATEVVLDLVRLLGQGASAVLALGPVPARELAPVRDALEQVPYRPPLRPSCDMAEGGVEILRGTPENVELRLALPGPDDPRFDLLPALETYLGVALARSFSQPTVAIEVEGGCSRLVVRVPAGDESPLSLLRRLRQRVAEVGAAMPTADEATRAASACGGNAIAVAVAAPRVARELAVRLAHGGRLGGALTMPVLDPAALGELARQVLRGHSGYARVTEAERRLRSPDRVTLDNGTLVAVEWTSSEVGVTAVALGGVDPGVGASILAAAAERVLRKGWGVAQADILGVLTLSVAAPGGELTELSETLGEALTAGAASPSEGLLAQLFASLGLRPVATGETVSVVVIAPEDQDVAAEAASKFFGALPAGAVRVIAATAGSGLSWSPGAAPPRIAARIALAPSPGGAVVAEILRARLRTAPGVTARIVTTPGHLVLVVTGEGENHVPALDAQLAREWQKSVRRATDQETRSAQQRLWEVLFGDAARWAARNAAAPFLPFVPSEAAILAVTSREANQELAGLPSWDAVIRLGQGPAPQVVDPAPTRGRVRKSPPARP